MIAWLFTILSVGFVIASIPVDGLPGAGLALAGVVFAVMGFRHGRRGGAS